MKRSTALADQSLGSAGDSMARIGWNAQGLLDAASSARKPGLPTASPISSIQKRAFFMAEIHHCSVYSNPYSVVFRIWISGKASFDLVVSLAGNAFVACNEV